jgi:hypothetical protein
LCEFLSFLFFRRFDGTAREEESSIYFLSFLSLIVFDGTARKEERHSVYRTERGKESVVS